MAERGSVLVIAAVIVGTYKYRAERGSVLVIAAVIVGTYRYRAERGSVLVIAAVIVGTYSYRAERGSVLVIAAFIVGTYSYGAERGSILTTPLLLHFCKLPAASLAFKLSSCLQRCFFLNELVPEEAFRLLSKHFVGVLAVVVSALHEPQILDSLQLLLHEPATNFWINPISASEGILKKNGVKIGISEVKRLKRVCRCVRVGARVSPHQSKPESCRASFGELGLMTLPCLYVFEVIVYCRSRCALISGRDVHQYETRGRDNLRTHQRRLALSQHLPQQVGVRLINKLPEDIKNSNNLNQFKTRLRRLLVSKAFYSIDEFMTSRWDD
ncbi:hypothetical protein J6590_083406 [Homalodisca vitripennis]|nr:hypothetical protein J6590_083406 [Homalodisca vitripennis]